VAHGRDKPGARTEGSVMGETAQKKKKNQGSAGWESVKVRKTTTEERESLGQGTVRDLAKP